jgi:hypothetical protein
MAKTMGDLFFYLTFLFDFLLIIQVLFYSNKRITSKVLWLFFSASCMNSVCNYIQPEISHSYEYLFLVCYTIVEYSVFAYFFSLVINNKIFQKVILLFSVIFLAVVILNYNAGKNQRIDSFPIGVETIIVLIYSFYYLYEQMNIVDETFIYERFHFWMVIGIMIFLSGSFFVYIFANQVDYQILLDYWFLTYLFYVIKNAFVIIGIYLYAKEKKLKGVNKFRPYLS